MDEVSMKAIAYRIGRLEALVAEYYAAVALGRQMEDPSHEDVQEYNEIMDHLQARALEVLGVDIVHKTKRVRCLASSAFSLPVVTPLP